MTLNYFYKTMPSPVGELKLVASDDGLIAVLWENDDPKRVLFDAALQESSRHPVLREAEQQLEAYAHGRYRSLFHDGLRRVVAGDTSLEEVLRVTHEA